VGSKDGWGSARAAIDPGFQSAFEAYAFASVRIGLVFVQQSEFVVIDLDPETFDRGSRVRIDDGIACLSQPEFVSAKALEEIRSERRGAPKDGL